MSRILSRIRCKQQTTIAEGWHRCLVLDNQRDKNDVLHVSFDQIPFIFYNHLEALRTRTHTHLPRLRCLFFVVVVVHFLSLLLGVLSRYHPFFIHHQHRYKRRVELFRCVLDWLRCFRMVAFKRN